MSTINEEKGPLEQIVNWKCDLEESLLSMFNLQDIEPGFLGTHKDWRLDYIYNISQIKSLGQNHLKVTNNST